MKKSRLPLLSLAFFRRTNLAVLLGMAVGTAVLTGALIVGDSVRGSLRRMTLERLGRIDDALVANRFFGEGLAARLEDGAGDSGDPSDPFGASIEADPAILMTGSVENARTSALARGVNVVGYGPRFWSFGVEEGAKSGSKSPGQSTESLLALKGSDIALNQALADEIGVVKGDAVIIRVPRPDPIPTEAVHGRRSGNTAAIRLNVAEIVSAQPLARFGLRPSQQLPLNVFIPLPTLQRRLDQKGLVNAILLADGADDKFSDARLAELGQLLGARANLADRALTLRENEAHGYLSLQSTRMVLRESDEIAARDTAHALGVGSAPVLTYLANTISIVYSAGGGDTDSPARIASDLDPEAGSPAREIPYSTITALDPTAAAPFGPFKLTDGTPAPKLGRRDILLNSWAAERLDARVGDSVRISYYTTGAVGQFETTTVEDFTLRGIVAIQGAGADPGLTPDYPGISDADNIRDWDPPFPIDLSLIGDEDEAYWKLHHATPKAFIALETGLELWTSRFGRLTSFRFAPGDGESIGQLAIRVEAELLARVSPESTGLAFLPVKRQGLDAAKGASDFGGLFIAFSFFIIASAMMLVRILFSLGVDHRAREVGILLASGYTARDVGRLFMIEGLVLSSLGGAVGLGLGVGYAALMLHGLRTWWVGSVGTTFLWLTVRPLSLGLGFGLGVGAGLTSVWLALRVLSKLQPSRLLAGHTMAAAAAPQSRDAAKRKHLDLNIGHGATVAALGMLTASGFAEGEAAAGLFFGGGAAALVAALAYVSVWLGAEPSGLARPGSPLAMAALGARNASRHKSRSLMTIALVASATFVIAAVSTFRHGGGAGEVRKDSGNGGFALMAESDSPLLYDLGNAEDRSELGFRSLDADPLASSRFFGLRLNPGEDASCLNLYRPQRPRILGAPSSMIERGGFEFASSLAETEEDKANPWRLLQGEVSETEAGAAIPAIGDLNTIMWILHSGLGKTLSIEDDTGRRFALKIVATLKRSALQSELVISEENFIRLFPERSGYQFFMIESPEDDTAAVRESLEATLRPFGFDAFSTNERIARYLAVENTYISTFQALGGLGLLLGTLGLAAVMLRNVLERRSELALLRSLGFGPRDLALMVAAENAFLLCLGLGVGAGAAALAVAPHAWAHPGAVPWATLAVMLLGIFLIGMLSGLAAVVAAIRSPLLDSLRAP